MRVPTAFVATILALSSCQPKLPQPPAPIDPSTYAADCRAIYQQELGREPDPGGLTNCTQIMVKAKQDGEAIPQEVFRAFVRASDEWRARQEAQKVVVLPRQRARGQFIENEDGTWHTVIETSDFALYDKWLKGIDIEPVLAQREALGFNSVRVFGVSLNNFPEHALTLTPQRYGDRYYTEIPKFFQALAKHHLYGSWIAFASAFEIPNEADQFVHWDKTIAALQGVTNVRLSLVNEDSAHGQYKLAALLRFPQPIGVFSSRGSNGATPDQANGLNPPAPYWQWIELHLNDAFEYQRKAHNCMELSQVHPCIISEQTRVPDHVSSPARIYDMAQVAALLVAGSTFHSLAGRVSALFEGVTLELAKQHVSGAKSIPLSCQVPQYFHRTNDEIAEENRTGLLRVYQRGDDRTCRARVRR